MQQQEKVQLKDCAMQLLSKVSVISRLLTTCSVTSICHVALLKLNDTLLLPALTLIGYSSYPGGGESH